MPRKLPSSVSVQTVHDFLKTFIAPSESDDDILPKNGAYSPFYGFSRFYPQHTNLQDGGTSLDGISRAGVNKVVGRMFQEGMRKPSRNGNPGDLNMADAHKLARHFLKLRWRNPDHAADLVVLQQAWNEMQPQQVVESVRVLRILCQWKPGPAGRGGDRGSRRAACLTKEDGEEGTARRKMMDGSAQRVCKAWMDEDDADALSERSTVAPSERGPNTNRPDALSMSIPSTGKRSLDARDWASALGAPSIGSSVASSAMGRLSSQDLLQQLARQMKQPPAAPAPTASPGMTAAELLAASSPQLQPPSPWAPASSSHSFAATLLSNTSAPSAAAALVSSAPSKPTPPSVPHEAPPLASRAGAAPDERREGLTLPPLSISTTLPPLKAILQKAFA